MKKIFPVSPYFSEEDRKFILEEIDKILKGEGFLSNHKWNREFEKEYANYVGSKYALTTNNGTSALELMYTASNLKGSEIIIPTNTFAATAFAAIHAGAKPVFADISDDLCLSPESVEDKITNKTKAVVVVHIGGFISPNVEILKEICDKNGLYLLEDAAHAQGSILNGQKAGTFGEAAATSFFSTKVITTGEGGMITTNNEELYEKAILIRDQAKVKKGIYQNYHEEIGDNFRMTEIQALIGLIQLRNLEKFIEKRTKIARLYDKGLRGSLRFIEVPKNSRPNYYKWIGFFSGDREKLYLAMREKGIFMGGLVYEFPLHILPAFLAYASGELPNSEKLCSQIICPPIHSQMTEDDVNLVVKNLKEEILP